MAESLCQKRALEAFQLDPAKWGGNKTKHIYTCGIANFFLSCQFHFVCLNLHCISLE